MESKGETLIIEKEAPKESIHLRYKLHMSIPKGPVRPRVTTMALPQDGGGLGTHSNGDAQDYILLVTT